MIGQLSKYMVFTFLTFIFLLFSGQSAVADQGLATIEMSAQLAAIQQTIEKRLTAIENRLDKLAKPVWEYKLIFPNMMTSRQAETGIYDGVNFKAMGRDGWEVINYSVQYGFIFKRRAR
jgi:hypothetical protein